MIALDTVPCFFVCRVLRLLGFILLLAVLHTAGVARAGDPGRVPGARLPLRFAVNAGQWEDGVLFGAIRGMDKVAFAREGVFLFRPMEHRGTPRLSDVPTWDAGERELQVSGLRFVRASANMRVEGFDEAATRTHFYSGADSARWRGNVPTYRGVRYREVWPGVDVEYVEREGRLLQRIVLSAGADAERVAIVAGNLGGNALSGIEAEGSLYRRGDTLRVKPQRNNFELRQVIETEVNTYFGGSGFDGITSMDLARDDAMLLYMRTTSMDLPLRSALQGTHRGGPFNIDVYVACLEADMRELRFATYLGGTGDDEPSPRRRSGAQPRINGRFMRSTTSNDVVLLNNPESLDFPITANALQPLRYTSPDQSRRNGAAALVAITANGMLRTSTWLGGPRWFGAYLLDLGPDGSVYVIGTASGRQWFVRPGGLQDTIRNGAGCDDGITPLLVLARLSPALDSVRNATYFFAPDGIMDTLEVPNFDYLGMIVDSEGNVVLTGNWGGAYLPVVNAWITVGNRWDRYIAKFDPTLSQLRFCSHLPQRVPMFSSTDYGEALTTDRWNNIWLLSTLETLAEDTIPIIGPYGKVVGQNILYKFRPDGGVPEFSFHLPWNRDEIPIGTTSLLSDSCGRILFFGTTSAPDDSLLDNPFTGPVPSTWTHFIAAMDPASAAVEYCGYFHTDSSYSGIYEHDPPIPVLGRLSSGLAQLYNGVCAVDKGGNLVLAGVVGLGGLNIITPLRAFQSVAGRETDGYLIRTRVPGCELLGCAIAMPTLLTVGEMPP
ncbi:MAG TPA: hypothetical protein PK916_13835, partial [Bacteroidota bacterium]|nr:hypothetical protein [Bacteroidota bacterium]